MAMCQTCQGQRYIEVPINEPATPVLVGGRVMRVIPCPQCGGTAIESCCDGEDRWQQEKRTDPDRPGQ